MSLFRDKLHWAFQLYDKDCSGAIDLKEMIEVNIDLKDIIDFKINFATFRLKIPYTGDTESLDRCG